MLLHCQQAMSHKSFTLWCRASNTTLREYDHAVKNGAKRSVEAGKREEQKCWEEVREKWHALQHLLHKRTSLLAARKGKGKASAGEPPRQLNAFSRCVSSNLWHAMACITGQQGEEEEMEGPCWTLPQTSPVR